MAHPGIPETEKGQDEQIQSENNVDCLFRRQGCGPQESVPQGQTVNAAYYVDVLERLRKRVIRVRKNIAATWVLHLDNAPSHKSLRVREFLAKHNVATLPQPRSSSGRLFLFPRIKTTLKGRRFDSIDAIQAAVTTALKKVPVEAFERAYRA